MDLYDELVKTAKNSESNIYGCAKTEILSLVDLLKTITREDAKKGLFSSKIQIEQATYPSIFYIYKYLDCLNCLSGTLNRLLGSALDVVILSDDSPNTITIKVEWFRTLHMFLLDDLEKGK